MSKTNNPADSATRVKAFRERLADGSYRRVEAYITDEEKARLESVKTELGVTSDVAVAGLLRMGLEAYANSQATTEVASAQSLCLTAAVAGALQGNSMNFCGSMPEMSLMAFGASAPLHPGSEPPAADNNPIARFFQSRSKEIQK